MTPKERAVMQQALEALEAVSTAKERGFGIEYAKGYVDPVITALREALAEQAEQEPVAEVVSEHTHGEYESIKKLVDYRLPCKTKLYAAPVRTKDLTPHEITALIREGAADGGWQGFAQRVIAADREKNK